MTELDRHRLAVNLALVALQDLCGAENRAYTGPRCNKAIEQINNILHPEPEYEEVEVVRWECAKCGNVEHSPDYVVCCTSHNPATAIKLTGTLRRPKPQKVERSVSGEVCWNEEPKVGVYPYNTGNTESIQWERLAGKIGHMTFTWTEEGEGK